MGTKTAYSAEKRIAVLAMLVATSSINWAACGASPMPGRRPIWSSLSHVESAIYDRAQIALQEGAVPGW